MDFRQWLAQFRHLHDAAKRGVLDGSSLADYHTARDELARALLAAQHVAIEPGQRPRRQLRALRALQVDVAFFDGTLRATTRQVSSGGFSALLAHAPKAGEEVKVTLRLPGTDPLQVAAQVVETKPQAGNAHVSFQWVGLGEEEVERLEVFVFDAVLEELKV
jgi:hypothetical protein